MADGLLCRPDLSCHVLRVASPRSESAGQVNGQGRLWATVPAPVSPTQLVSQRGTSSSQFPVREAKAHVGAGSLRSKERVPQPHECLWLLVPRLQETPQGAAVSSRAADDSEASGGPSLPIYSSVTHWVPLLPPLWVPLRR